MSRHLDSVQKVVGGAERGCKELYKLRHSLPDVIEKSESKRGVM